MRYGSIPIGRGTVSTNAAFIYTAVGDYDRALRHAEDLLEENSNDINGLVTAIIHHQAQGNGSESEALAERLVTAHPDFSTEAYLASKFLQNHEVGEKSRAFLLAAGLPE